MEFVGNQISLKSIAITVVTAFLVGRICLFGGTFPAAVALITVMLAVSTIYIYLVPVLAGAMAFYIGEGILISGDLAAILFLGLFFLFFHQQKFTINQRTAIAIAAVMIFHCIYYGMKEILFLLRPEMMLQEAAAILVYIRVWNTMAKILYTVGPVSSISREKAALSLNIFAVSLIGAIGNGQIVFSLWMLIAGILLLEKGLQQALSFSGIACIFWLCQGESQWEMFALLFTGLMIGWYSAGLVDFRYRKTVVAVILFVITGLQGETFLYGITAAMAVFLALPSTWLTKIFCLCEEFFLPEVSAEKDLQHLAIRKDLLKKKEAFLSLGQLYGANLEGKQIISYQFLGMARTIEHLMKDLQGCGMSSASRAAIRLSVGQASYAFDQVSGDSMAAFAYDKHHVALIISDGMGKGKKASEESKLVVTTLSRLLQAGFDVDLAMKTVNGILMTGNQEERFATVDLAIIDRHKCRAKIYKMGAATTFIKHEDGVSVLKRQALPAGITQGLDLEYIDIKLRKGDILVMVSDGVTDCDRKDPGCSWLRERLMEISSKDPETIAELVVNKAAEKYGIHERDDLSVITAAIGI